MNAALRNTPTSPSEARATVAEPTPNPNLLRSLGHLARGLSALFWGLPLSLVLCIQTANGDWFTSLGVLPALAATAVLFYGLFLLGRFQKQERVWNDALDRARIFALINAGLSPFLFWWSQIHSEIFFLMMVRAMTFSGLAFLFLLNPVLWRLSAMLPDETLRLETKFFTALNQYLVLFDAGLLVAYFVFRTSLEKYFPGFTQFYSHYEPALQWIPLLLVLAPVAMTMALIWKIKEVILSSVFGTGE
jgi:hypothetical protein